MYCRLENEVPLRIIQRRCYGLRDEDYLTRILTCMLWH